MSAPFAALGALCERQRYATTLGGAGTVVTLLSLYQARGVPNAFGFAAMALLSMVIVFVVIAMHSIVRGTRGKSLKDAALVVKSAGPMVPVWVTAVAWSSFIAALVLFLYGDG